jgi:putative intracellular protease/amidase
MQLQPMPLRPQLQVRNTRLHLQVRRELLVLTERKLPQLMMPWRSAPKMAPPLRAASTKSKLAKELSMRNTKLWVPITGAALATAVFTWPSAMAIAGTSGSTAAPTRNISTERIDPWKPRFGRTRPVIAVVGANSATELADFVVPFSVLSRAQNSDVLTVAMKPGLMKMRPALQIQPHATVQQFDARYPQGADYVIVPAVGNSSDPALLSWIKEQAAKGSSIVSICDGALVVANTGVMKGHRATAHWATEGLRREKYPQVRWQSNARYIADGKIVSSAGISAAVPVSLALVEAISGRGKAAAVAAAIGVRDWSAAHNSDQFQLSRPRNLFALFRTNYLNRWLHTRKPVGLPLAKDADEMALALLADGYTRTGRVQVVGVNKAMSPVVSRYGLTLVPDQPSLGRKSYNLEASIPPNTSHLEHALQGIERRYGRGTAYAVSLEFEYPAFVRGPTKNFAVQQ